ncbi:SNF1-related protein kinase catalytic subunit alpha KIN10-like [Trifolium pratense]|uniref:SNF1-related protein kinase catalytic subunit alpha KIN10-like n=1 Tax=Trifolium pratense TaxID=57577 RepID=UPI001E69240B|nr:SNF1-related protein kinase catalytic subunit alpha KIN10-like [Trifolium pratense]
MDGSTSIDCGSVDKCLSNYNLGKTLCFWTFGRVKFAEHVLSGDKVSIYIINRRWTLDKTMEEKVRREINTLRLLRHPHIIQVYEVVETTTHIYVIMEYLESGDLFDYIIVKGMLQEDEARKFFQQIISGVEYCHNNMVAHRDLRPENIFLDSKFNIKIADFSLSKTMQYGQLLKTSCGSATYAAPEVISGKLYAGSKVDVWSCGVILYAFLCGRLPFDEENIPKLYINIKGGVYNIPSYLSPGARDLISRLLEVDPMKRITILEIHQHPWFKISLPHYLALPPPPEKVQQSKKEELWLDNPGRKNVLFYLLSKLSWLLPRKLVNIFF